MVLDESELRSAIEAREELEEAQDDLERARQGYHLAIRRLYVNGGALREIAEALGLSHQRVHQIVESGGPVPAEDAPSKTLLKCTFCERSQKKVKKLIAGPGVYICDQCVAS